MRLEYLQNLFLMFLVAISGSVTFASAAEPVVPYPSEPSQKQQFFEPDRFSLTGSADAVKPVVEPHFSVSHDKREDNMSLGLMQTTETVFGEAGGKLNFLGDISLRSFARIPVYSKETVGSQKASEGASSSELFQKKGKLSWRSELGVPLKKGVDLNFFYDNSTFGIADRPGVDERDEKFGTRFIFKFK